MNIVHRRPVSYSCDYCVSSVMCEPWVEAEMGERIALSSHT